MNKSSFFTALTICTLLFAACWQMPTSKPVTAEGLSQMNRDFVKVLHFSK